ncbi:MAG: ACT domain-containing protein [Ignavibacteriae bacterium]|nr:ACT domain-containing protein [Ignavibacteriota bacterium]MCB9210229.1 ACT domain-containing protein [Ignavibacteriales bacterium]MCB9219024.1 ACT domain-containing protein [Ignavibacteriales bacterium]MCB9259609.1 ACT domain-containing protein [Ignavibacteriales bacterium]
MKLSESEIRAIAMQAINELGDNANPELVKEVVEKAIKNSEYVPIPETQSQTTGRVILTSFGLNHPGIVSNVTKVLSDANCDITDLSQKLMGDFYTMIIMLDISNSPKDLSEIQNDLNVVAEKMKIKVYLQHEDLFRFMHRV